jgi:MFS family permease
LRQPPLLTSTLLAIQLGCQGLFALAGGAVSDLISRRAAVLIGMTTATFGAALFVVQAPIVLLVLAILWGLASGFQSAGGQSFLIAAVSRTRLGSASAVYFISSTAAGAIGAYIAGRAADRFGFGIVTAGAVGLALVALALAARFLPPLGSDRHGGTARRGQSRLLAGYTDLLQRRDVLALGALRYFPTVAWGSASLAIPLLIFRLSGTKGAVGTYTMVSLLAAAGTQLLTGREIDRRTQHVGLHALRLMVAPIAAAILICAVAAATWSQSLSGLFAAGTAWTMAAWALSTTMPPLIHELGEGRDDGRLVALMHLMWSAGMLTGTVAAGALIDWHPAAPFTLAAGCLAVTFAVGLRFPRIGTPAPTKQAAAVGQVGA